MTKDEKIGTVRYQYALMAMLVTTGIIYSYLYTKRLDSTIFLAFTESEKVPKA